MTRLFDAGSVQQEADRRKQQREDTKRRAEEVDLALKEAGILDANANWLQKAVSTAADQSMAVTPIHYASFRKPNAKWMIEHAQVGKNYIYQVFPLKPPTVVWQDIVGMMIASMDVIFPRSIQISYVPPDESLSTKYYTIRVLDVAGIPGWQDACERALHGLVAIDAWQR